MALESLQLTWLETLEQNTIDSWGALRQVFIDNF